MTRRITEWLARVKQLEARGELLSAYDECLRGIAAHPHAAALKHRAVLNLARSGATGLAVERLREFGLVGHADDDIAALEARLVKDQALRQSGDERRATALHAAKLYERIYRRTGNYYPGINAATMALVGAEPERARRLARGVLRALARVPRREAAGYYVAATRAEAALILGRDDAATWIVESAARSQRNYAELASTRRQLRLICSLLGTPESLLSPLEAPRVIHFLGHRISPPGVSGRFPASDEDEVAYRIADALATANAGFGYGSLASGADILFAEALLARGAELHIVLPFAAEDFTAKSVVDSGPRWLRRFRSCLRRATSVSYATQDNYLGHPSIFAYASSLAMGMAAMRAHRLDATVEQIAVWDGAPAGGPGGTADDVVFWRKLGLPSTVITPPHAAPPSPRPTITAAAVGEGAQRPARAIMFGDVKGFSKLTDVQVITFVGSVMGALGKTLDRFGSAVLYRNTWGDAVYLIVETADAAARCALALQETMAGLSLETLGLPDTLALRIGGHFGPVWEREDPVLRHPSFFGAHVSRAARIEPIAIPGHVFVSEPFAARLALETQAFDFEYVGERDSAKSYGAMRMYLLRPRAAG